MTNLQPFFITVVFITKRKPKNTKFYVLVTQMDSEWRFQFQKQVIIKIPVKNDQVTNLLYNSHFFYQKKYLLEESPKIMQIYRKNIKKPLKKFCKNLTQQVRVRVKKNAEICPNVKGSLMATRQKENLQQNDNAQMILIID